MLEEFRLIGETLGLTEGVVAPDFLRW